jgi:iron complex outermembrane receptor protein
MIDDTPEENTGTRWRTLLAAALASTCAAGNSIQAFSGIELEERTAGDISQIGDFTPNLEFDSTSPISGSSNAAVVFIRGIGQTDFVLTSDPGVGVYLDGVYISRAMGGVLDLLDIERVEVLRGPQGTLFGKNTVGGAISVITKKPGPDVELQASVTAGNDDRLDGMLSVNVPLSEDSLFLRASLATRNRDGYGERLLTGESMGNVDSDTARSSLLWLATDALEFTWAFDYTRAKEDMPVTSLIMADPNIGGRNNLSGLYNLYATLGWVDGPLYNESWLTDSEFTSNGTAQVGSDTEVWGTSLTADWDLGMAVLKSITAYRETDASFGRDTDHSPVTIIHTSNEMQLEQFSQEFNLSGLAFDGRLDWLVGAYYFEEEGEDLPDIPILTAVYEADQEFASGPGNGNGYLGEPLPQFSVRGDIDIDNTSLALFFHNSYAITDKLSTTFGLRYTDEEKKTNLDVFYPTSGFRLIQNPYARQTFDDWSPRIGFEYRWTDELFGYVSYSEGFKSGGVVSRYNMPRVDPIVFDPEQVKSYEAGFKSEWLDRRLRLNAAVFYTDYTDIQVTVFNGVVPETRNAAEGEITGAEVEFTGVLAERLVLSGGLGYMDAEYTKLDDPEQGALEVSSDHAFVNTPEWSANASLEYRRSLDQAGEIALRLDYSYRSEVANDAANTPELIEDSLSLWNARAAWIPSNNQWELAVFGRNLTDESYLTSGVSTTAFGIIEGIYGRPREYGVTLKYLYQ